MKTKRYFFATSLLVLTLLLPAYAGDMHTPPATQPPPPSPATEPADEITGTNGDMSTPGAASSYDPTLEAAMSLIRSVLSLF